MEGIAKVENQLKSFTVKYDPEQLLCTATGEGWGVRTLDQVRRLLLVAVVTAQNHKPRRPQGNMLQMANFVADGWEIENEAKKSPTPSNSFVPPQLSPRRITAPAAPTEYIILDFALSSSI